MYQMKTIVNYQEEIALPKCMYHLKNPNISLNDEVDSFNINISNQVMKFLNKTTNPKMAELEQRQEVLIKKLDVLYNRIKTISSYCNPDAVTESLKDTTKKSKQCSVPQLEEAVLSVTPDNLPYYLNLVLKSAAVNFSWHIHSSVPNENVPIIKAFVKTLENSESKPYANLRLIFSNASAKAELKLSSLSTPIIGTVNILRYLSFVYPNIFPYNSDDFSIDSLLDTCHTMEYSTDAEMVPLSKKLFANAKGWIYNNSLSVVDIAAFNVVKQSKNAMKLAPKSWIDKCEKSFN